MLLNRVYAVIERIIFLKLLVAWYKQYKSSAPKHLSSLSQPLSRVVASVYQSPFSLIVFKDKWQQIRQPLPYYNFQLWEDCYQQYCPFHIYSLQLNTEVHEFRSLTLHIVTDFYWNGKSDCIFLVLKWWFSTEHLLNFVVV